MFRHLTTGERRALASRLAARGVTPQQFAQAQEQARTTTEALARAYGEAIGRQVTPVEFITGVIGIEGAGRLFVCALHEITGHTDLHRDA
ncbi:hypothetical protein [Streptomyces antimycoticus]|uniref:hypothetical protein n=1 Tax=Streptomyces antimycoticus TaxID=68175 RepID=UPI00382166FE